VAVIPGAVIGQGTLGLAAESWRAQRFLFFSVLCASAVNPNSSVGVLRLFFSQEPAQDGRAYYSFVRLIIRGNTIHYTR
jgi:hypothetical protein